MAAHRLRGCLPWPKLAQALQAFPCYNSPQIICFGSFATPSVIERGGCTAIAPDNRHLIATFNLRIYTPKFSSWAGFVPAYRLKRGVGGFYLALVRESANFEDVNQTSTDL